MARPSSTTQGSQERGRRPIDRTERPQRDASARRTSKPRTTLAQTSQTAALRTCMDTVSECFDHCLEQGGRHVAADNLRAHIDCWDLLNVTSSMVARGSRFAEDVKPVCADAVKQC